jgi:hypothetical protein
MVCYKLISSGFSERGLGNALRQNLKLYDDDDEPEEEETDATINPPPNT